MGINLRIRHVAAWIACFSILLAALVPTISHGLSAAREKNSYRADICSVSNSTQLQATAQSDHDTSAPGKKGMAFEHCPYCLTYAGSFGLPPTAGFTLPVLGGTAILPSLFYQSPRPLFAWTTPYSRAPPVFS